MTATASTLALAVATLLLASPATADPFPRDAIELGMQVGTCVATAGIQQGLLQVKPGKAFPPVLAVLPGREADYGELQRRCAAAAMGEAGR